MPTKITETIERWCCAPQDMKPYRGEGFTPTMQFCVHCGQVFRQKTRQAKDGSEKIYFVKAAVYAAMSD